MKNSLQKAPCMEIARAVVCMEITRGRSREGWPVWRLREGWPVHVLTSFVRKAPCMEIARGVACLGQVGNNQCVCKRLLGQLGILGCARGGASMSMNEPLILSLVLRDIATPWLA